jgi:hypothetical protein
MSRGAPYRYDQPVDDAALFVGRWDTVRDIAARARRGESFAVLGGTRIGKTSLFEQVRQVLAARPETAAGRVVVPVFLSAQQFGRLSRSAIFAAVLDELGGRLSGDTADGLARAVGELRRGDVAEDFAFDHFVAALKRAMATDDTFQLFILLDEVDELRQHDWSKHFFTNHRFLISQSDLRQRINVMIAGTLSSVDLWNTAGSPFYNVVTLVEMGLVDDDAIRTLIEVGFPDGLPEGLEAAVLRDVGGHPYLTQYVLSRLWEHEGDPDAGTLERIGQQFLRERRGDFQRWWNACNDDAKRLFGEVVASRALFKKHTAIEVFAGDVDRVERALDQLLVNGLVREMAPNRFEAGSRLFAHWALERITAPTLPAAQVSPGAVTEEVEFELPTRLADLLAIWEGRRANQAQLTPVFYRRLGASLEAAGEPLIASDVYTEALDRWPQAGARFAARQCRALIRGGAPRRAQDLHARRRNAGYQDEDLGDEVLPDRETAGVAVFVGASAADTTSESTRLAGQLTHLLDELDVRYGYTSAAAGPEILFAEGVVARGGDLHLVLPCPVDEFRERRVDPVRGWTTRFEHPLGAAATVEVMGRRHALHNRAAVDYARRAALGLATFRARHLSARLTPMAAWAGDEDRDGVAETVRFWRDRGFDSRILALPARETVEEAAPAIGPEREHRIVSLLFADTARFSQLDDVQLRRFGDHYLGRIAELVERSDHAPVVKNTWGDGLYMVFLTVRDAGMFALELSDLFHRTDWQAAGMPPDLRTRVGLHVGPSHSLTDPLTGQFTFMGHHVSRAARIEQITPPGSVYASRAFAALAAAEGLDEFVCEYAGRKPLPKGYGTFPVFHLIRV